jgi:formylglycine-generating enzyme required for sulfatase activity
MLCAGAIALERAELFPLWRLAVRWSPNGLPSVRAAPASEIASGLPILALAMDEASLYGPTGILTNKLEHGADWEREGSVAYFEGGQLRFASGVGVRVHGGGSRYTSPRQGFRLYFRRRYGPREFAPGILFGPGAQPLRRLIVHNDVRRDSDGTHWYFVNPLSYDIAGRMGAIVPETKPVKFFLNGEYYGPFVLTERFDERFFAAHWGYDDILLSQEAFDALWAWVQRTRPLTMDKVASQVDLENLTRWFLSVAFCATRDAYQGPGQRLDLTRPQGGWFWVNWDMDQGLRNWDLDSYQYLLERISEARRGRNRAEPRAVLLTHLLAQDPQYRDFFKRIFLQVMNHRVTAAFLEERYRHYETVGATLGLTDTAYLRRLRQFLTERPAFFRLLTEQWLNTPPSQPVTLVAPDGVSLIIDGERVRSGYQGLYFPDLDVSVEVAPENRRQFSGWQVNGRAVAGDWRLSVRVDRPTRIEALFNGSAHAPATVPHIPSPTPPVSAAPRPRPEWRAIPAGSFLMGCVPGDTGCDRAEMPRVPVSITEPFQMMAHEVTAGDFQAFAGETAQQMPRQPVWYADARHPVVNVTWDEAQAYCAWMGGRLPTEEQWEYAARGGLEGRRFPWGDDEAQPSNTRPIPSDANPSRRTMPVGSFEPTGFGLYDMAGNVWEWTASLHQPTHATDPANDGYELRTIKGGSWDSTPGRRRVSERAALARHGRHNLYVGFRCIRAAPPQP